jgi:hypothetical protein
MRVLKLTQSLEAASSGSLDWRKPVVDPMGGGGGFLDFVVTLFKNELKHVLPALELGDVIRILPHPPSQVTLNRLWYCNLIGLVWPIMMRIASLCSLLLAGALSLDCS